MTAEGKDQDMPQLCFLKRAAAELKRVRAARCVYMHRFIQLKEGCVVDVDVDRNGNWCRALVKCEFVNPLMPRPTKGTPSTTSARWI